MSYTIWSLDVCGHDGDESLPTHFTSVEPGFICNGQDRQRATAGGTLFDIRPRRSVAVRSVVEPCVANETRAGEIDTIRKPDDGILLASDRVMASIKELFMTFEIRLNRGNQRSDENYGND